MIKFGTLNDAVSKRGRMLNTINTFSVRSAYSSMDTIVVPATGFHLYCDLFLSDALMTAESERSAKILLEAIEDVADIASAAAAELSDVWLFEVQGLRIHIFIEASDSDPGSIARMLAVASYLANAVDRRLRALVGSDYRRFCMAVAHGDAVVISTGREGDDSLISLGNAANRPAKRLGREDVGDGILALPIEMAKSSPLLAQELAAQASNNWVHVDVLRRKLAVLLSQTETVNFDTAINESIQSRSSRRRTVKLASNSREFLASAAAAVEASVVASGLVLRADLDGFTAKIEAAAKGGESAVRAVVEEFLQILEIPDAFESHLEQPVKRLPWAGDCYNVIILPEKDQTYADLQKNLLPIACLHWHDPEGAVNASRAEALKRTAAAQKWSIGIAGGKVGKLLVANIATRDRSFTVAAGWGVRYSLEAQVSRGLSASESAVHIDDHAEMCDPYKNKFVSWEGGRGFRKANAVSLQQAADGQIERLTPNQLVPSITVPNIKVSSRPYCQNVKRLKM